MVLCLLALALSVQNSWAQQRPSIPQTTQQNPRGADIVEPMAVYQITARDGEPADTLYLGIAKIPDPRLGQEGAFVTRDVNTGTMIRISDAIILTDNGLRRIVEFDPRATVERLMFVAGPYDRVVSRQGVSAARSIPGDVSVFDISDLYDAARINPITGENGVSSLGTARTAYLRMESTYPGGEAVPLAIPIVPHERPLRLERIEIVRRDTVIMRSPSINYTLHQPPPVRVFTVLAGVQTGYGPRYVQTEVPATTRAPFVTDGWADFYFVDGWMAIERPTHRWKATLFGTSSLVESDISPIEHHQVEIRSSLRFEYGQRSFVAIEASGRLADKPHQEFSWSSADYAGILLIGPGQRITDWRGLERTRMEALVGLRMGENRVIEVYEAGARSRGLGPQILLSASRHQMSLAMLELRADGHLSAYTISGRGARDRGFNERGILAIGQLSAGREIANMFIYGALRGTLHRQNATYANGDRFFANDGLIAPAAGIEMRF